MLFLSSPRGVGIAPTIERSVVLGTSVPLLSFPRFHGFGQTNRSPPSVLKQTAPTKTTKNWAARRYPVPRLSCERGYRGELTALPHRRYQTELLERAKIITLLPGFDGLPSSKAEDGDDRHGDRLASCGDALSDLVVSGTYSCYRCYTRQAIGERGTAPL